MSRITEPNCRYIVKYYYALTSHINQKHKKDGTGDNRKEGNKKNLENSYRTLFLGVSTKYRANSFGFA